MIDPIMEAILDANKDTLRPILLLPQKIDALEEVFQRIADELANERRNIQITMLESETYKEKARDLREAKQKLEIAQKERTKYQYVLNKFIEIPTKGRALKEYLNASQKMVQLDADIREYKETIRMNEPEKLMNDAMLKSFKSRKGRYEKMIEEATKESLKLEVPKQIGSHKPDIDCDIAELKTVLERYSYFMAIGDKKKVILSPKIIGDWINSKDKDYVGFKTAILAEILKLKNSRVQAFATGKGSVKRTQPAEAYIDPDMLLTAIATVLVNQSRSENPEIYRAIEDELGTWRNRKLKESQDVTLRIALIDDEIRRYIGYKQ